MGDEIIVTASTRMAVSALIIGFGLPLIVLIAVIIIVRFMTSDEIMAALCGLATLVPYYILVWLVREKLRVRMAFEIE